MAVNEENRGARKTQTLRMSIVMWKKCRTWYRTADVIISPGERKQKHTIIIWQNCSTRQENLTTIYGLTRINGATNDPPQRIPSPVIKPVVKLIKSFFCQEAGGTVVEVPGCDIKVKVRQDSSGGKTINVMNDDADSTYGSNSWMTLSNLNTEKSLVENAEEGKERSHGSLWCVCCIVLSMLSYSASRGLTEDSGHRQDQ